VSTAPFRFGNVQWRFGAVGLLSNTLLTPGLGYLIVVVTAVTLRHVRAQRVLSVLAWVIAAGLLALLGMFSLDALQTRAMVTPAMHTPFIIASVTAAGKLLLWAIVFVLFGRAARAPRALRRSAEAGSPSLLIRDAQAPSTVART
jgi:hypothetical protein